MTQDGIYNAIKKDKLILRFGAILLKKLGRAKALDISQRMRQLGRLLLKLVHIDSTKNSLEDFISGESFDTVVKATEDMCGIMTSSLYVKTLCKCIPMSYYFYRLYPF